MAAFLETAPPCEEMSHTYSRVCKNVNKNVRYLSLRVLGRHWFQGKTLRNLSLSVHEHPLVSTENTGKSFVMST